MESGVGEAKAGKARSGRRASKASMVVVCGPRGVGFGPGLSVQEVRVAELSGVSDRRTVVSPRLI